MTALLLGVLAADRMRTTAQINSRQTPIEPKNEQTDYLRQLLGIGAGNSSKNSK